MKMSVNKKTNTNRNIVTKTNTNIMRKKRKKQIYNKVVLFLMYNIIVGVLW